MSEELSIPLLPLATKTLRLQPGEIVPAVEDSPYVVHFTMAALDVTGAEKSDKPSTLKMIRIPEDDEDEELAEEEDDEPVVLLTLSSKTHYQQALDLYVSPTEGVCFQVVGSQPIHLTGNIVDHPITQELLEEMDGDDEDEDSQSGSDDQMDEDELDEIPELENVEDDSESESQSEEESEDEIQEIDDDEDEDEEEDTLPEPEVSDKKRAKQQSEAEGKKKVKFSASLEKGPEATESKYPTKKLDGNVVIEDRKPGDGPSARKGSRVSMRYVGKLANGKVFDRNTSGKPFTFGLGRGEVIKGWDIGIAGMKAGGERRIIIPAAMAYGKQALPGIPSNSELRFDVKCLSVK